MTIYLVSVATLLVVILLVGLARLIRGPSNADRMLAAQLFGTVGVGVLLLLAEAYSQAALLDAALTLALLAPMTLLAFIRLSGARQ